MNHIVTAGFLLLRPVPRPDWLSPAHLPGQVVSASDCICPQFPGPYAISWCSETAEDRAAAFDQVGLAPDKRDAATKWATDEFESAFGWPGVFFTLDAAREARARFFPGGELLVVGVGLPVQYRATFVSEATPQQATPGFAPQGKSGSLTAIEMDQPLPADAAILGYEPLNVTSGQLDHSWLCNQLEQYAADHLDVRPGPSGHIESLADAARCCEAIARRDVGAEPGPWLPWLLARYV